jgi:hypothetical protein
MAESGTIAPLLEGVGAAGVAGAAASPPEEETAEVEDAAEVMPVRVPEAMEATVDSPAAAVAAILAGTSMVFEVDVVEVVDELVLEEVVLEVTS